MSYEEDYRKPYKSRCACGKGFLRCYYITESNEFNQTREKSTEVEICCENCRKHYHYERGFLVPNGLSFPEPVDSLKPQYRYDSDEKFIDGHSKSTIEAMISDMTAPKHRFIKDLVYGPAVDFANQWALSHRKKSLAPMVEYLRQILSQYEKIEASYRKKRPYVEEYEKRKNEIEQETEKVEDNSFRAIFKYDEERDRLEKERAQAEREQYINAHRYDPFQATVTYHTSYKFNLVGRHWDSYIIKDCIDPQYLILEKPEYGEPKITIVKKYLCECSICGKQLEVNSSDFEILNSGGAGYYPKLVCDCHDVSSFEAKTMDILNELGVSYMREFSFEGLTGDFGYPLRFDFALCGQKKRDENGEPLVQLLIELQGPHHYKLGYYNENGEFVEDTNNSSSIRFLRQIEYDRRKKAFCEDKGLPFEQIKYTEGGSYEKLKQRIVDLLEKHGLVTNGLPF